MTWSCDSCICISSIPSTEVIGLKFLSGSFGVKGVKSWQKCSNLSILRSALISCDLCITCICISLTSQTWHGVRGQPGITCDHWVKSWFCPWWPLRLQWTFYMTLVNRSKVKKAICGSASVTTTCLVTIWSTKYIISPAELNLHAFNYVLFQYYLYISKKLWFSLLTCMIKLINNAFF